MCVHTQRSIHGSSTHIRAQERPDSINKEAKQITLASSQCMCMRVHANTHAYKYTCGGYISSSCALTVVFWSKHTKIINLISLSEWVLLFFPKQMLLCCLWVWRQSERHGWKYWFSPPSQLQPKHHSRLRHYVNWNLLRQNESFRLRMCRPDFSHNAKIQQMFNQSTESLPGLSRPLTVAIQRENVIFWRGSTLELYFSVQAVISLTTHNIKSLLYLELWK